MKLPDPTIVSETDLGSLPKWVRDLIIAFRHSGEIWKAVAVRHEADITSRLIPA